MGQLLSSPRTRYATCERRRRKDALKSKQSTINEPLHPDYDYYHWVSGGSPERLGNGQTASRSVIPKPHQGDRKSASSRASHPTSVHTTSRVKEDVSSKSDGHQTRKNTSKKPKSGHIKTKKAGESNAKHKSISRQDSHHDGHTDKKKEKRECVVCTDTLSLHRFPDRPPTTNCKHKVDVCRKCLRTWITSEFDTKMWDDIKCPVCSTLMQKADMRHFAPKDIFKRYVELSSRAKQEARPGFTWCNRKGCKAGQVHLPNTPKFRCNTCERTSCVVHNVKWHKGETCSEYDYRTNARLKAEEEEASKTLMEATTKPCPGCTRPIEKNQGCNHMQCAKCHVHFCWTCLLPYYASGAFARASGAYCVCRQNRG